MSLQNRVIQNLVTVVVVTLVSLSSTLSSGQDLDPLRPLSELPYSLEDLQDVFLEWPGDSATSEYASIDGRQMQHYIVEQQQISRRYRDTVIHNTGAASSALPRIGKVRHGWKKDSMTSA